MKKKSSQQKLKMFTIFVLLISITNCLYNKEYAKSWQWKSNSSHTSSQTGAEFVSYSHMSIYADLPMGIDIKDDGTLWSIDIKEFHRTPASYPVCFGLQDVTNWDYVNTRRNTEWHSNSILACSNRNNYANIPDSSFYVHSPFDYLGRIGGKYDMILENDKFYVSNENYGKFTKIEFTIDPARKYYPVIYSYSNTYTDTYQFRVVLNTCFRRCQTCQDWNYKTCLTCISDPNNQPAPSCHCKSTHTHYYNNSINDLCQPMPNYQHPSPTDWPWIFQNESQKVNDRVELGYRKYTAAGYQEVDMRESAIGIQHAQDGVRWTIEVSEVNLNNDFFCLGIRGMQNGFTSSYGNYNGIGYNVVYSGNVATSTTVQQNGRDIGLTLGLVGQKFDMIFTDTHFTITTFPYFGDIDYKWEYDQQYQYIPSMYTAAQLQMRVAACSPRCNTCVYMEPEICLTCSDAANRQDAPGCECVSGKQDTFRHPDDHSIQNNCIDEYDYHEPEPPEWIWYTESPTAEELSGGKFQTLNGYAHYTVDLGPNGIRVLKDGVKWTIRITDHKAGNNYMCFGIQKSERAFYRSWTTSGVSGNVICTFQTHYSHDAKKMVLYGEPMPSRDANSGHIYDCIYRYGFFIITNENHGGNVRYEFELDQSLNFVPYVMVYSENVIQKQIFTVRGCSLRCQSCEAFEPTKCTICSDQANRPVTPECRCKADFEDFYDYEYHEKCRAVPVWEEPTYPEWEWYTKAVELYEDIDDIEGIYNNGVFISKSNTHTYIKLKDKNPLKPFQKWTVKIIQTNATGWFCFGIIDVTRTYTIYQGGSMHSQSVAQNTESVTSIYLSGGATSTYEGNIKPRGEQTGEIYDLYYYGDRLVISNKDRGGFYERTFFVNPDTTYTPFLNVYGAQSKIQVKGCSARCKTCQDWEPEVCIECASDLNRLAAPECYCEPTYEDFYDGQLQKECRPVEVYNERKPPEWIWDHPNIPNHVQEDILDQKENYGTFTTISTSGQLYLKDFAVIPDYSKWTVKILNHPSNAYICIGIREKYSADTITKTSSQLGSSTCFDTRAAQPLQHARHSTTDYERVILDPMPTVIESLKGEIFDLYYKSTELIITNENHRGADGGRKIKARFQLDPNLKFTPYIDIYQTYVQIQVKGCSKKCISCVDWRPRQCLECSDSKNREAKPCCQCKFGFTDWYGYKINEKCIVAEQIPIARYPEFEWEIKRPCASCFTSQKNKGTYRVFANDFTVLGLKDNKILTDDIMWEIKIKSQSTSGWVLFGIKPADIPYSTGNTPQYSIGILTDGTSMYYTVGYGGLGTIRKIGPLPASADRQENEGQIYQVIFRKEMLQISNIEYGGTVNYEIDLNPNVNFVPLIHMYGPEDSIQVSDCNLKCQTCKLWNPNYCYTCKGANRISEAPSCGCQAGFTDIYHNQQNVDCIPIYTGDHPNPSEWTWEKYTKITDTAVSMEHNGNGIWSTTSTLYGIGYVNLGHQGINGKNGGTRWSIQIENVESATSHVGFGIMSNEYLRSFVKGQFHRTYIHSELVGKLNYIDAPYYYEATHVILKQETYTSDQTIGKRYDLHYEDGFLKISNLAYGDHQHYEFSLKMSCNFFPVFQLYTTSDQFTTSINLKPCHWKCSQCNSSVSTTICTVCADLDTRNNDSQCTCKDGYYEDPEGYYKCRKCDPSCKTCSGPDVCLTCLLVPNRINSPPQCQCKIGYYSDVNNFCNACEHKCSECETAADFCTKCKVEANRNQINCECNPGFFDDPFSGSCKQCPAQCRTCIDGSGVCTDCACDRVLFNGSNASCPCPDNSFGASNSGSCQICEPPCSTCKDNNVCTACFYQGINRAGPPGCLCEPGFFEDEFHNCKTCIEGCAVCKDYAYRCVQCVVDPNRNQDPTSCQCNESYMHDPISGLCIKSSCPIKCNSCMAGSNVTCKTCAPTLTRNGLETNCACLDRYFDNGEIDCVQCVSPCAKCTALDSCLTCISTTGRKAAPDCSCETGFFDDGSDNCIQCHYKCSSCENSAENCLACKIQPNRKTSGDCACNTGYTEDPTTKSCVAMASCHYKCSDCDLANPDVCTECSIQPNTNRKDKINNCVCQDNYFDQGIPQCTKCGDLCASCSNTSDCDTCLYNGDDNRLGIPTCACKPGYIPNESNICVSENPVVVCPVEVGRSDDENCSCLPKFYEDPDTEKCLPCALECATCENDTECLTCAAGYISDALPICYKCNDLCEECNTLGECTSCVEGRHNPPDCECKNGYLPHETKPICTFCDDKCFECVNTPGNCVTCKGSQDFRYAPPECGCWEGFYDDRGICKRCDYKCLTCSGAADQCLICRNGEQRILVPPACACETGFYPTPYNNNCEYCSSECQVTSKSGRLLFENESPLVCASQCKSCQNYTNYCLVCQPGRNTTMIPPQCECLQGYYQDQNTENCLPCSSDCEKCTDIDKCLVCKKQNMYPNKQGQCQCMKGFIYEKTLKGCQQCYYFKGECLRSCPEGTQTQNNGNLCYSKEAIEKLSQASIQQYYETIGYGIGLVFLLTLSYKTLSYFFNK